MTSDPNGNPEVTSPAVADVSVEAKKRPATPVVPAERVKRKPVAQTKAKAEPSEKAATPSLSHKAASEAVRSVAEQSLDQVRSAFARSQEASNGAASAGACAAPSVFKFGSDVMVTSSGQSVPDQECLR